MGRRSLATTLGPAAPPRLRGPGAAARSQLVAMLAVCALSAPLPALAQSSGPPLELRGSLGNLAPQNAPQRPPTGGETPGQAVAPALAVPSSTAPVPVTLSAQLSDDTPRIESGLVWHVFQETPAVEGRTAKPVLTSKEAQPTLSLAPGTYIVAVGYGRATKTRRLVLRPGKGVTETLVLNAGGLRVTAVLVDNTPIPPGLVTYDIMSDERDQSGNRARLASLVKPGIVVRLNAGLYHIVSSYGDTNVQVRADVTVEAGKQSEAVITHAAGRITFKLVAAAGGEAIADTGWTISQLNGAVVKESAGAIPSHWFAPGNYSAVARSRGRSFRRDFSIAPGDNVELEIVMN